jgi:hypothetical protein
LQFLFFTFKGIQISSLKITIKIAQEITTFENIWDRFLPAEHHLRSKHLLAFEKSSVPDLINNYLLVYADDELIGLVYIQQFQFRQSNLNFSKDQSILIKMAKCILPSKLPLLICGHLLRINFQGFYFKKKEHTSHVCDAIELFTKQTNKPYGIIIKDCDHLFIEQRVKSFGYRLFNADITMEIYRRPHWLSFEDYLKDLQKGYFKRAKKIMAAFESIKIIPLTATEILENAKTIETLYWNVVNKQSIKLGTVDAGYFYHLKNDLQEKFEFNALYLDDIMVGFYTFIFYENEMETHFIGLDYETNKSHKLYFNILFFSLQKMITVQYSKLELGRTAREAKVNLGAEPKQIINYIKVKNKAATIILNYVLNQFNKTTSNNIVERTPLKTSI